MSQMYKHKGYFISILLVLYCAILFGQENQKQPFTTKDALRVKSIRIQDVTDDGEFIAATISTRKSRQNVDHLRFGDPTYISPYYSEFIVIDNRSDRTIPVFDDDVQVRAVRWSPDGEILAFFIREKDEYILATFERESQKKC